MPELNVVYHEAGHALAALLHDVPVRSASVVPDERSLGRVRYGSERASLESRLAILLAGREAERLAPQRPGRIPVGESSGDLQRARTIAAVIAGAQGAGLDEVWSRAEFAAARLIEENRTALEAIVVQLERKLYMTGDELRAVYERRQPKGTPAKRSRSARSEARNLFGWEATSTFTTTYGGDRATIKRGEWLCPEHEIVRKNPHRFKACDGLRYEPPMETIMQQMFGMAA